MQRFDQRPELRCCQLTASDRPSRAQYDAISTLIYETDPYIYPALFESNIDPLDAAKKILPSVFRHGNDDMFRKENLYVCVSDEDIVGLILWHKGKLNWNPRLFIGVAEDNGVQLIDQNVLAVSKGYVDDKYSEDTGENETVSLLNICVDGRMRGKGIGRKMISEFIKEHPSETMELCVLADNAPAVRLYKNMGFQIVNEASGFSLGEDKPRCYDMKRV